MSISKAARAACSEDSKNRWNHRPCTSAATNVWFRTIGASKSTESDSSLSRTQKAIPCRMASSGEVESSSFKNAESYGGGVSELGSGEIISIRFPETVAIRIISANVLPRPSPRRPSHTARTINSVSSSLAFWQAAPKEYSLAYSKTMPLAGSPAVMRVMAVARRVTVRKRSIHSGDEGCRTLTSMNSASVMGVDSFTFRGPVCHLPDCFLASPPEKGCPLRWPRMNNRNQS